MSAYLQSPTLPAQEIVRVRDEKAGLDGVIALHSTHLGSFLGGYKIGQDPTISEATAEALRRAEYRTYRAALAGLPFGGGAVLVRQPDPGFDRAVLLHAMEKAVRDLGERFVLVPGGADEPERDSHWRALGVLHTMQVAVQRKLGASLANLTVAVQGLSPAGLQLCAMLHRRGARLVIAEPKSELAARAAVQFGAEIKTLASLAEARADVFAPCGPEGTLDRWAIGRMRAAVVCGTADHQLAAAGDDQALAARGILYAPDFVANAGGDISLATRLLGWSEEAGLARTERVGATMEEVLDLAVLENLSPRQAAERLALRVVAESKRPQLVAA